MQKERMVWFHHRVAVFMLPTLVMRQSSLRTLSENLHLHSSSGSGVKKKQKNADSVYAGGVDMSQSFNKGTVPIMT